MMTKEDKDFFYYINSYQYFNNKEYFSFDVQINKLEYNRFLLKEFPSSKIKDIELLFFNKDKKYKKIYLKKEELNLKEKTKLIARINLAHRLLKSGLNKDVVYNYINNEVFPYNPCNYSFINKILRKYNDQRVCKLLFSENTKEWETEINHALDQLEGLDYEWPRKPKSLQEIHDFLLKEIKDKKKISKKNENLNPREDLILLDGKSIKVSGKELTVKIAKTLNDLELFSTRKYFNNCVGTFDSYFERGKKGESTFIGVFDKEKPLYCIETKKYRFKEAKGVSNSEIPVNLFNELENILTLIPEVPKDFTPIKHKFIHGYKYNYKDSTLYIAIGEENIYEYNGVSEDIYEEFVSTDYKGNFFNRVIKKHECNKIN